MVDNNNEERDPVQLALGNAVVFRHILTCLPFNDLKSFSEVNKSWNYEVRSYIRDFRRCNATISEVIPCFDLEKLNETLGQMDIIPINSLTVNLGPFSHSRCNAEAYNDETYVNLMKKLHLKYLSVNWDLFFGPVTCPANTFITKLLLERSGELYSLKFYCIPPNLRQYFDTNWAPFMPKLQVLDLGIVDGWLRQEELLLRMINAAPNIKKLKGFIDPRILQILPEDKYSMLDNFRLCVSDHEEARICLKLAQAGPALNQLFTAAPGYPLADPAQFLPSFYTALEKLLTSSQSTLEELSVNSNIFLFNQLSFPPLITLKFLYISTGRTNHKLLNVLKSIDYPKLCPALREVQVSADLEPDVPEEVVGGDALVPELEAPLNVCPSKTVSSLKIEIDLEQITFEDLQQLYPALTSMDVLPRVQHLSPMAYEQLWKLWPELESLEVAEGSAALSQNCDAAFLGVDPSEIEYLMQQDDEFLSNYHLVPIQPSILTMKKLRLLRIRFDSDEFGPEIQPNRVFLSRVTGFLAFKRGFPQLGAVVTAMYPGAVTGLQHLTPFVPVHFEG